MGGGHMVSRPTPQRVVFGRREDLVAGVVETAAEYLISVPFKHLQGQFMKGGL
jgi:hypothetical protein